ncbi:hypothetical protein GQX74_002530 [Glossina fuscipes]|nr:hypothetical protein GQX74_002530 [Glossina fuscipes]
MFSGLDVLILPSLRYKEQAENDAVRTNNNNNLKSVLLILLIVILADDCCCCCSSNCCIKSSASNIKVSSVELLKREFGSFATVVIIVLKTIYKEISLYNKNKKLKRRGKLKIEELDILFLNKGKIIKVGSDPVHGAYNSDFDGYQNLHLREFKNIIRENWVWSLVSKNLPPELSSSFINPSLNLIRGFVYTNHSCFLCSMLVSFASQFTESCRVATHHFAFLKTKKEDYYI